MTPYEIVKARSGNRCEAMVLAGGSAYTRCWSSPVEVHHLLTRSRGGLLLDEAGETNHLLALCTVHHKVAHGPGGHQKGLMINGYITTRPDGSLEYSGTDPRLLHLRQVEMRDLPEEVRGPDASP